MTAVDITSNTTINGNILDVFRYVVPITITGFSSMLRFIVSKIDGKWTFQSNGGMTTIVWKYSLHPGRIIGYIIISLFIARAMQNVLNDALSIIKMGYEKNKVTSA